MVAFCIRCCYALAGDPAGGVLVRSVWLYMDCNACLIVCGCFGALCGFLRRYIWRCGSFCGCGCFRPSVELVACPGAFRIFAGRSTV